VYNQCLDLMFRSDKVNAFVAMTLLNQGCNEVMLICEILFQLI